MKKFLVAAGVIVMGALLLVVVFWLSFWLSAEEAAGYLPPPTEGPPTDTPAPTETPVPATATPVPEPPTPAPPAPEPGEPWRPPVTPIPIPTETPTPGPPPCLEGRVYVIIRGGWAGIPVKLWVGGTAQEVRETKMTFLNEAEASWAFRKGGPWEVRAEPQTPPGKDPARWRYWPGGQTPKPVRVEGPGGKVVWEPKEDVFLLAGCQEVRIYFWLIDTWALRGP